MPDRVKVMLTKIEAVQEFILSGSHEVDDAVDAITMLADLYKAIAEQEPVKPEWRQGKPSCGACGTLLLYKIFRQNYCHFCGRAVKWDD